MILSGVLPNAALHGFTHLLVVLLQGFDIGCWEGWFAGRGIEVLSDITDFLAETDPVIISRAGFILFYAVILGIEKSFSTTLTSSFKCRQVVAFVAFNIHRTPYLDVDDARIHGFLS